MTHQSRLDESHLLLFLLGSILIHCLGLSLVAFHVLSKLDWRKPPTPVETPTLTFLSAPPVPAVKSKPLFINTEDFQQSNKENPNALLESSHNTELKTDTPTPRNNNLPIPNLMGDPRSGLDPLDMRQSLPRKGSAGAPPSPMTQAKSTPPPSPASSSTQAKSNPQTPPSSTPSPARQMAKNDFIGPENALPVLPPQAKQTSPPPDSPSPETQSLPKPESPAVPASPASFFHRRGEADGANGQTGAPSPEARETPLGRYKSKVMRAIGSRWYLKVDTYNSSLSIGSVTIRYKIQANGVINYAEVKEKTGGNQLFETICMQSILESGPFEPFPESMKLQLGDGFEDEVSFAIY